MGGPAAQLATYENSSGLNIPQIINFRSWVMIMVVSFFEMHC